MWCSATSPPAKASEHENLPGAALLNVYVYNAAVRVVTRGRFSVYVYAEYGQPHHQPHCDVRWSDGNAQVALPGLRLLAGDDLLARARQLVRDELDRICDAWTQLNPERPI